MTTDRIEREILIDAPQEHVWAVLTRADLVAGWFGDSAEIDLRPGGKMVFSWSEHHSNHQARVERVDPPGFFSYRWARPSGEEVTPGNSTLVEFTLAPASEGGTRLRVVESGFASLAIDAEEQNTAVKQNTEGWRSELGELKNYAERLAT